MADSRTPDAPAPATAAPDGALRRRIGGFQATTLNMSQMCGVGPFITIPAMVVAFGGPQAIIGWIAGAVLALADGLVWAELVPPCPAPAAATSTCARRSSTGPAG